MAFPTWSLIFLMLYGIGYAIYYLGMILCVIVSIVIDKIRGLK